MNFLAHIYLSGNDNEIIIGNFIADMVKGKKINGYKPGIVNGIKLHRAIDEYTDNHPVVIKSKSRLRKKYRHYSPVIVDMYYDHFLARDWDKYSDIKINKFLSSAYNLLLKNYLILPGRGQKILPFMIANNWLAKYADFTNLQRNFEGMAKRTAFDSKMEEAVNDLIFDYQKYYEEFNLFFPEIIKFSQEFTNGLNK